MRTKLLTAAALSLTLVASSFALQRAVSDQEMVQQSDQIVYGTVQELEYDYSNSVYPVMTRVLLSVQDTWKGQQSNSVWLTYPGGIKGEFTMNVSDTPELSIGDEGLFFLYNKDNSSSQWLYGWEYGAIKVENGQAHSLNFAVEHDGNSHQISLDTVVGQLETLLNSEER